MRKGAVDPSLSLRTIWLRQQGAVCRFIAQQQPDHPTACLSVSPAAQILLEQPRNYSRAALNPPTPYSLAEDCRITGNNRVFGNEGPRIKADEDSKTH
jgi:hypothetical protein